MTIDNVVRIIKSSSRERWHIISEYEEDGFSVREESVELRAHYIVDITNKPPTIQRKFSIVHTFTSEGNLYEDTPLWEGNSIDDNTLVGFDILDFESKHTKGRISGIKIMNIYHYVPINVYVVYEYDSDHTISNSTSDE